MHCVHYGTEGLVDNLNALPNLIKDRFTRFKSFRILLRIRTKGDRRLLNRFRQIRRLFRELPYLSGDYRKTFPMLPSAGRLNAGVKGKDIRSLRHLLDRLIVLDDLIKLLDHFPIPLLKGEGERVEGIKMSDKCAKLFPTFIRKIRRCIGILCDGCQLLCKMIQ